MHACWNQAAIDLVDTSHGNELAVDLYARFAAETEEHQRGDDIGKAFAAEWRQYHRLLKDPDWSPVLLPAHAAVDAAYQMQNPLRVLSSGEEAPTRKPFWAGGKWLMADRVKWWEHYDYPVPVIVGHYWRRLSEAGPMLSDKYGPDLFAGIEPQQWMGKRGNVYCVDFSVGARSVQRANHAPINPYKLAAVRVPEWDVMHDDGEVWQIGKPGGV